MNSAHVGVVLLVARSLTTVFELYGFRQQCEHVGLWTCGFYDFIIIIPNQLSVFIFNSLLLIPVLVELMPSECGENKG